MAIQEVGKGLVQHQTKTRAALKGQDTGTRSIQAWKVHIHATIGIGNSCRNYVSIFNEFDLGMVWIQHSLLSTKFPGSYMQGPTKWQVCQYMHSSS